MKGNEMGKKNDELLSIITELQQRVRQYRGQNAQQANTITELQEELANVTREANDLEEALKEELEAQGKELQSATAYIAEVVEQLNADPAEAIYAGTEHEVILKLYLTTGTEYELRHVVGWGLEDDAGHGIAQWIIHVDQPDNHFQRYHFNAEHVMGIGVHISNPPSTDPDDVEEAADFARPITEEDIADFEAVLGGSIDPSKLWVSRDEVTEPEAPDEPA